MKQWLYKFIEFKMAIAKYDLELNTSIYKVVCYFDLKHWT